MRARHLRSIAWGLGTAVVLVPAVALLLATGVAGAGVLFVLLFAGGYLAGHRPARPSYSPIDKEDAPSTMDEAGAPRNAATPSPAEVTEPAGAVTVAVDFLGRSDVADERPPLRI